MTRTYFQPVVSGSSGVCDLVALQASRLPEKVAVSDASNRVTYAELEKRAAGVSMYLRTAGVRHGELVGVCVSKSPDMVAALLGVMKSGAAYVPMDPSFPVERLRYMANDAQVSLLLADKKLAHLASLLEVRCLFVEDVDFEYAKGDQSDVALLAAEDLAYVIYTSGSTGNPKGVEVSHGAIINCLCSMQHLPGCVEKDVFLSVTTLSFDISALEIFLPLISGACVELASPQEVVDGRLLIERIERCRPTIMQATPVTWRMLISAGWKGAANMVALCGGETLPRDLANQLLDRTAALWNMYGPTETTIWSTLAKVEPGRLPPTIGMPIANTEVHVLDHALQRVPAGAEGELYIGGLGVARGYRNLPALTAEKFVADPFNPQTLRRLFRTGDLVRLQSDGNLVHLGRLDSQVKVNGFRIALEEVQATLLEHPNIDQAIVKAIDSGTGSNQLAAYVVTRDGAEMEPATLRDFLRTRLPEYMVPSFFIFMVSFPLTSNNKVDVKLLPEPRSNAMGTSLVGGAPRTRLETQILAIWRQVLEYDALGIHDNFFDAGGNSLRAIQLLSQIELIVGFRLPLDVLFQVPTVAQMAEHWSRKQWNPYNKSLVAIQPGGCSPPFFAVPGAGGNVLMFGRLARLMGQDQPFYGLQARGTDNLEQPFDSIVEMASQYVSEIKVVQPVGPYFVGGSCTGGIVAFEMAQQLVSSGETVYLVILDSLHPQSYKSYLGFSASFWRFNYIFSRAASYLRTLWHMRLRQWPAFLCTKVRNAVRSLKTDSVETLDRTELQVLGIYRKNMAAFARYHVHPYAGSLINVVASSRRHEPGVEDTRRCWEGLAKNHGRTFMIAAADSGQLFVSPHVEILAQLLRDVSATMSAVEKMPDDMR